MDKNQKLGTFVALLTFAILSVYIEAIVIRYVTITITVVIALLFGMAIEHDTEKEN